MATKPTTRIEAFFVKPPHETSSYKFWSVDGGNIQGNVMCDEERDAEMICAALNLVAKYNSVKRRAQNMAGVLQYMSELFE
jgi:hypothetical protein